MQNDKSHPAQSPARPHSEDEDDATRLRTGSATPAPKSQAQDGPMPATGPQPQTVYSEAAKKSLDQAEHTTRD